MARKMKTMDGNSAVAHVSYAFTDVAAIYPITPSSVMADLTDKFSAMGTKNLFGREVQVTEKTSKSSQRRRDAPGTDARERSLRLPLFRL